MLTKSCEKVAQNFTCELCDYNTSKKSSFDKHLLTSKHKKLTNVNKLETKNFQEEKILTDLSCDICNKNYKSRVGLWKHKQKCKIETNNTKEEKIKSDEPSDKEIIMMLINENKDFKQLLIDVCKEKDEYKQMMMKVIENGTHNTNTTTTTNNNSHNKAFNLNFFLNETCKDAMNITDFVDSIKLQLSDLERVGELGYIEGISSIIVKNLKELDVTKRPVHCTDKKRETIYIKDENQWEKDDEKKKMHKLVRKVADKNARMIPKYKEVNPDYRKPSSKCSDQYNKIIVESMGGAGDNDYEKEEKIIKKVTKEVIVNKDIE
jgi:hypothetical protein